MADVEHYQEGNANLCGLDPLNNTFQVFPEQWDHIKPEHRCKRCEAILKRREQSNATS